MISGADKLENNWISHPLPIADGNVK
jgi:hypothetical protein